MLTLKFIFQTHDPPEAVCTPLAKSLNFFVFLETFFFFSTNLGSIRVSWRTCPCRNGVWNTFCRPPRRRRTQSCTSSPGRRPLCRSCSRSSPWTANGTGTARGCCAIRDPTSSCPRTLSEINYNFNTRARVRCRCRGRWVRQQRRAQIGFHFKIFSISYTRNP